MNVRAVTQCAMIRPRQLHTLAVDSGDPGCAVHLLLFALLSNLICYWWPMMHDARVLARL